MAYKVSLSLPCTRCGTVAYWRVFGIDGGEEGAFCSVHADAALKRFDKSEAKVKRSLRDGRTEPA